MTGGSAEMALTVRTQFGAGRSSGSQHSQSLEALLAHIPGLTVVMPSTPADTYGLLRRGHPGPEPGRLHREPAALRDEGPAASGRPPPPHRPLGRRPAGSDVTVVSVSRMVHEATGGGRGAGRRGDLGGGDRPADGGAARPRTPSSPRCTRPAGCSSPTRRWSPSASAPRSRPSVAREASGTSTRRSSAWGPPPRRRPTRPTLERAWLPDRDDIADAIRRLVAI